MLLAHLDTDDAAEHAHHRQATAAAAQGAESVAEYQEATEGHAAAAAGVPVAVAVVAAEPVRTIPLAPSAWTVQTLTPAAGDTLQVAAAHPQRARLVIVNTGTGPAYLAPTRYIGAAGYVLAAGAQLELHHRGDVWANVVSAGAVLSVSTEYVTA